MFHVGLSSWSRHACFDGVQHHAHHLPGSWRGEREKGEGLADHGHIRLRGHVQNLYGICSYHVLRRLPVCFNCLVI